MNEDLEKSELANVGFLQRFKNKLSFIPRKWLNLLPVLLILLALPAVVFVARLETKTESSAQKATKPDIVVVMIDDYGAIDNRVLERLPNIKALFVDQGMNFDNAHDETPLCCPGRATFLTGQHTRNHGVTYNKAALLNENTTIGKAMHDAGYYTIMTGKYLNHPETLKDKTPPGWDKVAMLYDWKGNKSSRFWVQGTLKTEGFMDRFTADQSLKWLQKAPSNKPLFMWVNSHAPHKTNDSISKNPWDTDIESKYIGDQRCKNISPWKPADYAWSKQPQGFPLTKICESMLTIDDAVGSLRAEMAKQGRNPIWIFTSDNGMAWGVDGWPMKNVPQAAKSLLVFTGPGIPHVTTQALVSFIDLSPTIADLGGASMPWKDGISFANILTTGSNNFRAWMIEDHPLGGNDRAGGTTGPWWGIRTPQWWYVEWKKRGNLLFDLVNDPNRLHNLASNRPDIISYLKNLINSTNPLLRHEDISPTITSIPSATPISNISNSFVESQGIVAFEAEHFSNNIPESHSWEVQSDSKASNGQYINTPTDGLKFTAPDGAETKYSIYFSTPGTYYVWLRTYSPGGTSNAVSVGIDGVANQNPINSPTYKSWVWGDKDANKKPVTINISSTGLHTFSVWERKDGTRLDKIILSLSSAEPTGLGLSESPAPTETLTPTFTPTPITTETSKLTSPSSLVKWLEAPYPIPSETYIDDE